MQFSGKVRLMVILKVTKKPGFTLFFEDLFLEKPQSGVNYPLPPPPPFLPLAILELKRLLFINSEKFHCYVSNQKATLY